MSRWEAIVALLFFDLQPQDVLLCHDDSQYNNREAPKLKTITINQIASIYYVAKSFIGQIRHQQIFSECIDWWCAEKRNIAKNTGYGVAEFNEADSPHIVGPGIYDKFLIATVINIDVIQPIGKKECHYGTSQF